MSFNAPDFVRGYMGQGWSVASALHKPKFNRRSEG
jgi:hypothetical protein